MTHIVKFHAESNHSVKEAL